MSTNTVAGDFPGPGRRFLEVHIVTLIHLLEGIEPRPAESSESSSSSVQWHLPQPGADAPAHLRQRSHLLRSIHGGCKRRRFLILEASSSTQTKQMVPILVLGEKVEEPGGGIRLSSVPPIAHISHSMTG